MISEIIAARSRLRRSQASRHGPRPSMRASGLTAVSAATSPSPVWLISRPSSLGHGRVQLGVLDAWTGSAQVLAGKYRVQAGSVVLGPVLECRVERRVHLDTVLLRLRAARVEPTPRGRVRGAG